MQTKNLDDSHVRYLSIKTNLLTTKLCQNFKNILIRVSVDIQDQLVLKLDNWSSTHIYLNLGGKNEESVFVIYSANVILGHYGILSENFNNLIEQILTIINWLNGKIKNNL